MLGGRDSEMRCVYVDGTRISKDRRWGSNHKTIGRLVTSTSLFSNDVGKALHLVLGTTEGTDTTLDEFTGTLVLGVTDKLHSTTLIRSETSNLTDDGADDFDTLTLTTLAVGGTGCKHSSLGLVSAVDAPDETYEKQVDRNGMRG